MTASADFFDLDSVPRDRWERPLILDTDTGELSPYTRVSTFADTLSDAGGLVTWKGRVAALGMARSEDLAALAAALVYPTHDDPKKEKALHKPINKILDGYIEEAICRVDDRARYGTAVHSFTEPDASEHIPSRMRPDVDAYHATLTALGITVVDTELFVVNDEWKVAGTLDHIYGIPGLGLVVGDKKTGSVHPQEVAIQLRSYAGAQRYDHHTGTRTPLGVRTDVGVLVHIPRLEGAAHVYTVDLLEAERACKAAAWVREWRGRDDLLTSLTPIQVAS